MEHFHDKERTTSLERANLSSEDIFDEILRPDAEEDFAKEYPTRDPNPDKLLYLQGYEGELLREIATESSDTTKDDESNFFPLKKGES